MTELQNTKCKICTLLLIQNDCETLKKLITKFNNPIFCMEIIFAVSEENFNEEKLFFGLVEECFNEESYKQYLGKINCFGQQMEDLITQQFNIESAHLKIF